MAKTTTTTRKEFQWGERLEHFLLYKMAQGTAERTLADYRYHVGLFLRTSRLSSGDYEAVKMASFELLRR